MIPSIPSTAVATFLAYALMALLCIAWVRFFRSLWSAIVCVGVCMTIFAVAHTDLSQAQMASTGLIGAVLTALVLILYLLVRARVRGRHLRRSTYDPGYTPIAIRMAETAPAPARPARQRPGRGRGRVHYIPAPQEPEREMRQRQPRPAPAPAPARQQRRGGYVVNAPASRARLQEPERRRANVW